jgi:hypothetical protein
VIYSGEEEEIFGPRARLSFIVVGVVILATILRGWLSLGIQNSCSALHTNQEGCTALNSTLVADLPRYASHHETLRICSSLYTTSGPGILDPASSRISLQYETSLGQSVVSCCEAAAYCRYVFWRPSSMGSLRPCQSTCATFDKQKGSSSIWTHRTIRKWSAHDVIDAVKPCCTQGSNYRAGLQ